MTGDRTDPTSFNILYVCTGNTCRSPMAAALTRHAVAERGWHHVEVRSAGTGALAGAPASDQVNVVLREKGVPVESHQASELTPELVDWADSILVMGETHLSVVAAMGGGEKAAMITRFLTGDEADQPVLDPFGGSVDTYRDTADQLERAVLAVLDRLQPILAP